MRTKLAVLLAIVALAAVVLSNRSSAELQICNPNNTNIVFVINGTNCFIKTNHYTTIYATNVFDIEWPPEIYVWTNFTTWEGSPVTVAPDPPNLDRLEFPAPLDSPIDFTNGPPPEIHFDFIILTRLKPEYLGEGSGNYLWVVGVVWDEGIENWRAKVIASDYHQPE